MNSHDLITIYTSSHNHRIHLIKNLLERNNIRSFIADSNLENIIGTAFVEGYRLQVVSTDVMRAKQLIQKESE